MRQELDDLLCQRSPDIFRDRHGDMSETGMCWGFGCGDRWFNIIDGLCVEITSQVKAGTIPPEIASRVKEKAGHLRFYIRGHFKGDENPEVHRLIDLAQQKAERICQECGKPVELPGVRRCQSIRSGSLKKAGVRFAVSVQKVTPTSDSSQVPTDP